MLAGSAVPPSGGPRHASCRDRGHDAPAEAATRRLAVPEERLEFVLIDGIHRSAVDALVADEGLCTIPGTICSRIVY
jgi:hypothetical protein